MELGRAIVVGRRGANPYFSKKTMATEFTYIDNANVEWTILKVRFAVCFLLNQQTLEWAPIAFILSHYFKLNILWIDLDYPTCAIYDIVCSVFEKTFYFVMVTVTTVRFGHILMSYQSLFMI